MSATCPGMVYNVTTNQGGTMSDRVINNLEFLAIKMLEHPGRSGRFYRGELYRYRHPKSWKFRKESCRNGRESDSYASYFLAKNGYVGKLWEDRAEPSVEIISYWNHYKKPRISRWYLTPAGEKLAREARKKLGLDPA